MSAGRSQEYLVSAIVSTYNAERFLRGKLEDLEAQSITGELEIIVIDSASPQNERAIVAEFQARYPNIRYLRTEKRETVYQAWNRGVRMATGEFVTNANTDDRLRPDAYETLVRALREHPECVLAYPDMRITEQENATFEAHAPLGFRDWPPYDRLALLELCCIGPFPLWRRSLHDEIGYFDERYKSAADYEFWLRAALKHDFIHVPEFLGLYWLSPETVSRKGDLPTLEYLQVQKRYRPEYAPLTPAPRLLTAGEQAVYEALLSRIAGGVPDAIAQLERFAELHPGFAGAHHELAELYYKAGEIGYAKKHFEKAALLDPGSTEYWDQLQAFLKSELYQSLQHHKAQAAANPEDLEAHLGAGMICILLDRPEAARAHYQRALALAPDSILARENLAALPVPSHNSHNSHSSHNSHNSHNSAGYFAFPRPEVQRLVSRRARKILDVGCAAGRVGAGVKERQGAEVWGVECDPEAAAQAAQVLDRVLTAPIEQALKELPDGYFNCIILADVLEHLVDPAAILAGLAQKLAGSGEMVVSLPNVAHWSVLQGLLNGSWEYQDAGILDRSHLRFFTRESALRLFADAGFSAASVIPIALSGQTGIPERLLQALLQEGVAGPDFARESGAYQYLFRLVRQESAVTSIVILTYNELDCTRECLESIERNTPEPHEVILVDNGSSDGTLPFLREFCAGRSHYRLIENGRNLGFAAGCNIGMRLARGGRILLLNNDVVLTRGWLTGMLECLEREPAAAIAGPMTNEIAGPQRLGETSYRNLEELEQFARAFKRENAGRRIPVDRVVGFCMLFTRELMELVGELDENFGTGNFEDDDYCLRAALAGFGCVIAGDVFIHHYGSRSFRANSIDYSRAMAKNRALFDAKWDLAGLDEALAKKVVSHNALVRGRRLAQQGRLSEAVDLVLQQGIRFSPGSREPYRLLAEVLIESGRFQDALEVLEQMPAKEDVASLILAARCRLGMGRRQGEGELGEAGGSIGAGNHAAPAAPPVQERPEGRTNTRFAPRESVVGANLVFAQSEALQLAEQALRLEPECAGARYLKGLVLLERGERGAAEELFRSAIAADLGFGPCYSALAGLAWERGARDQALDLAELGFVLSPLDLASLARYHDYADALKTLGREARRVREARAIHPEHKGLAFGLIEILIRGGRYPEAMEEIERAAVEFGMDDAMIDAALQIRELAAPPAPAQGSSGSVSVCMIVKDEAQHLPAALLSVKPLAQEIVVVDTGSSDRTCDIARIFGARLFSFPWNGSFSDARNFSLSRALGEWILVLDADEVLAPVDLPPLRALLEQSRGPTAYSFTTRNYTEAITRKNWSANTGEYPAQERGHGWTPSEKVRLFPNDSRVRFLGAVHELLELSLAQCGIPIHACDVPVHHYGKLDPARNAEKQESYYLLGLRKLSETEASVESLSELALQATELGRFREAEGLWHRVLELRPESADAYFNLGYLHLATANYREARAHALRGVELAPEMKEAAFNLAKCEFYLGHTERAHGVCLELLRKCPGYPPALSLLSVSCLLLGSRQEAEQLAEQLRRQRFDCADFLNEYADGLLKGERGDLAAPLLDFAEKYRAGQAA